MYGYPYNAEDGREDLSKKDDFTRTLRGGAFFNTSRDVRCAFRGRYYPGDWHSDLGIRVVVSPSCVEIPAGFDHALALAGSGALRGSRLALSSLAICQPLANA